MNNPSNRLQELFAKAIALNDSSKRKAFLAHECGDDEQLRCQVLDLLAAHDKPQGFLDCPTENAGPDAIPAFQAVDKVEPGTIVDGRYKLREKIGEGGMGTVWVAEQLQPVRRKVALKLIKPGMDSRQVLARFDAERQALAMMDHPSIAKVFDGGVTAQGRPFFAMEYVKGMPLTEYCDHARLTLAERLKLFVPICQAVQHAHQKGIIHRDLKPSNVLICQYDGQPVPKVIDFGLAKAMYQPLTDQSIYTSHGLMLGTPLYMSPEQAEHNNLDVDTRSDIYSLGVILYELLTGSTPLEKQQLKEAAFNEILRLIKEVEPPKPSTRLSSSASLPSIAAQRGIDAKQLTRSLAGDLDWIVMKALDKDRGRRYESANGLARDIQRFLNDEAVEACPPSAAYKLKRFTRKNRRLIATAGAFMTLLAIGTIVSAWQAYRATQEQARAVQAEENARAERVQAELQRDQAQRLQHEAIERSAQLEQLTTEQRRVLYAAEMNLVRIEAQRGNLARMREILLQQLPINGEEDLRGFEWNYWYRYLSQAKVVNRFERHTPTSGTVLAVLPNGHHVGWSERNTTQLISLQDGTTVQFPYQMRSLVERTRFSDSGRAITGVFQSQAAFMPPATGPTLDKQCIVYERTGGKIVFEYPVDSFSHISFLNISPDGKRIVVLGNDASHKSNEPAVRICVWDVETKNLLLNEVQHRELNRVEFSHNGQRIAAHLCHGTRRYTNDLRDVVVVLDVADGKEVGVLAHNDDVDSVFWLPDGNRLLLGTLGFSGSNSKQLLTWSPGDSAPKLLTQEAMPDYMTGSVNPDGSMLAITGRSLSNILLIDTASGDTIDRLHHEGANLESVTFSRDGTSIVASSTAGEVLTWELGRTKDLFALRSKPLKQLAIDGFVISRDQSLLAIVLADGTVMLRTREGSETLLKPGLPKSTRGTSTLTISYDNRYLAHRSNIGTDGKPLTSDKRMLELFDVQQKRRLWQVAVPAGPGKSSLTSLLATMEFSADNSQLVYVASRSTTVVDCQTGTGRTMQALGGRDKTIAPLGIARQPDSGRLFFATSSLIEAGKLSVHLCDAVTGEAIYQCNVDGTNVGIPIASPDGEHISLLRLGTGVEVWNLRTANRVIAVPGMLADFSPSGSHIAIIEAIMNGNNATFEGCSVWETATGRKLCDLPFKGNQLHGLRFSPDGKRLLSLHGRFNYSGTSAHGRLWDANSGREILDIPVADVDHLNWELAYDASGQMLTKLLLGKSSGTGSGGASEVLDARPLDPGDDAALIADRLIAKLDEQFPLIREKLAAIEARKGLKPAVRETALGKVKSMQDDPDRLARSIGEALVQTNSTEVLFRHALVWAKELQVLERKSLRSRVLLGTAQFRNGLIDDALKSLEREPVPEEIDNVGPEAGKQPGRSNRKPNAWVPVRQAILALVYARKGDVLKSQDVVNGLLTIQKFNQTPERFQTLLVSEALFTIQKKLVAAPKESIPAAQRLEQSFSSMDKNSDGEIDQSEAVPGMWREAVAYDADQNGRLNRDEHKLCTLDMARFGRAMRELRSFPVEQQLEFLEEVVRSAPNYIPARNARAWTIATTADGNLRNAKQAMEDATHACQVTQWKESGYLDTLAAAYADNGKFEKAIEWQTKAIVLLKDKTKLADYQERLEMYQQGVPWREASASPRESLIGSIAFQAPLLAPDIVHQARRISGFGVAWSPDSRRIVRNLKFGDPDGGLEVVDLATNQAQLICKDGGDPVWSSQPSEKIYFVRGPEGTMRSSDNESIWQCDPNGENLIKLTDGGYPSLTTDGRLFVRKVSSDGKVFLSTVSLKDRKTALSDASGEALYSGYPSVSPDGQLVAFSSKDMQLRIKQIGTAKDKHQIITGNLKMVYGGWSPESRYFVYGSVNPTVSGLWLLDVSTGEQRLLADIAATNARWSPDGRFIAADERAKNQIVILKVAGLGIDN